MSERRTLGHLAAVVMALTATPLAALERLSLPDPTRPPAAHRSAVIRATIEQPQEFVVTAIKITGDSRRALVNDRLVTLGDRIGEAEIVAIDAGVVVIDYLSQRLEVSLLPAGVRKTGPATAAASVKAPASPR